MQLGLLDKMKISEYVWSESHKFILEEAKI